MEQRCNPAWSSTSPVLGELGSASSPRDGSRYQVIIKAFPKARSAPHADLQHPAPLPAAQGMMEEHAVSLWLTTSRLFRFPGHVCKEE